MYNKKHTNNSQYAYATGRIRALEAHLIGSARIGRYLEARSAEDIERLLIENGYPAAPDPEISLNLELEAVYALIRSLSANPVFIDALLLARDFHNLKVMLKAFSIYWPRRESGATANATQATDQNRESGGYARTEGSADLESPQAQSVLWPAIHGPVTFEQLQPMLQKPTTFDPFKLFTALREQKPRDIPPALANAAAAAASRYQQTYDISEIDIFLDKTLAQMMSNTAQSLADPFFSGYIKLRLDLINIGLLMRTRFLNSGAGYLQRILLPGGSLNPVDLIALYEAPPATITQTLKRTALATLSDAIEHFPDGGDAIAKFSLAVDNVMIQYVQKARLVLRGPEVLIGYLIAREMEIKTVRVILTCLRNRIPVEKARELARLTYL